MSIHKKNKLLIGIAIIASLLLVVLISYKIGSRTEQTKTSSGKLEQRKVLYYRSPMDPNYISEKPGKSPMGMDLIPVYEGEETKTEAGGVRIDPTTVQNIGVKTELITRRDLSREIRTVARIDYDETKIAYVNTKIGGWIEKLYVDYTGQVVKKGEKLLEIYSPELVATQEEYLLALEYDKKMKESSVEDMSHRAHSLLEASKKRLEYWDIPQVHIEELKQTGQVKKALMIHSPATGVVVHKNVLEGKYAKPGENLYRIADLSKVWVYADIYEYELPWVNTGQETEISLSYLPGKIFKGTITYVYPYLEKKTRTVKVRMEFDNPEGKLKPDMYADVMIKTKTKESAVAVPKESIIHSGERKVIIIDKGRGFFEPRDVRLGIETKNYYEVIEGVNEGEKVVTSSQFLIDSESRLKEAINKMLGAKKSKASEEKIAMPEHEKMKMAQEIKGSARRVMDDVWEQYFYIRENLAGDSLTDIEQKMRLIQEKMKIILDSDESEEMKNLAGDILESSNKFYTVDITQVREGFLDLSKAMVSYMKKFDRENARAKNYRLFFCGMEKKYWVQKKDKIGNPYVGESMTDCGAMEGY